MTGVSGNAAKGSKEARCRGGSLVGKMPRHEALHRDGSVATRVLLAGASLTTFLKARQARSDEKDVGLLPSTRDVSEPA